MVTRGAIPLRLRLGDRPLWVDTPCSCSVRRSHTLAVVNHCDEHGAWASPPHPPSILWGEHREWGCWTLRARCEVTWPGDRSSGAALAVTWGAHEVPECGTQGLVQSCDAAWSPWVPWYPLCRKAPPGKEGKQDRVLLGVSLLRPLLCLLLQTDINP